MIYTTKELLKKGESEYSIRTKCSTNNLHLIDRGLYSDSPDFDFDESFICKKYQKAVLTGLSAFYIYNLTDVVPEQFNLATAQHSFPIRRKDVVQSYQDDSFFEVGAIYKTIDCGQVRVFDLERTLIELIRLKEKYPRELFYEVLSSYRKIKDELDYPKLNKYLKHFSNGETILLKIKELI